MGKCLETTHVLIADCSPMTVKLIKQALLKNEIRGYHFSEEAIYAAHDGLDAFGLIGRKKEISLIISELDMPNLNGDELLDILADTGSLDEIEIAFVTTKEAAKNMCSSARKQSLGVIAKPFNVDNFPTRFNKLLDEQEAKFAEIEKIKEEQVAQRELVEQVIRKYLEVKELEKTIQIKNLEEMVEDYFDHTERIETNELEYIVVLALSDLCAKYDVEHTVDEKKVHCIFFKLKDQSRHRLGSNRYRLIDNFSTTIYMLNEKIKNVQRIGAKEILMDIITPTQEKANLVHKTADNFAPKKYHLFEPHFSYIISELEQIDCMVIDSDLQAMQYELEEVIDYVRWMDSYISNNKVLQEIDALQKAPKLVKEINIRLKKITQAMRPLIDNYTGEIDRHIWRKAKLSPDIAAYMKKHMINTLPNTKNFLYHKKQIKKDDLRKYDGYERESIVVVSNELNVLQGFKDKHKDIFPFWEFYGFSKADIADSWITINRTDKIVVDFEFKSSVFRNGYQFLNYLHRQHKKVRPLFEYGEIYFVVDNKRLEDFSAIKKDFPYVIIEKPLKTKEVKQKLLYG